MGGRAGGESLCPCPTGDVERAEFGNVYAIGRAANGALATKFGALLKAGVLTRRHPVGRGRVIFIHEGMALILN